MRKRDRVDPAGNYRGYGEMRVYDWLYEYIKPYEGSRYTVRYAETEHDFSLLVNKSRTAIAFIETDFFGEKTIGCLKHIRKGNSRLRIVLFSVSGRPLEDINCYLRWGADSFISLREDPEFVRERVRTAFDGYGRMSERILNGGREYNRLSEVPLHLTVQEVEVYRYAAKERERKEIAVCLGISVKTVDNHLSSIRRKFGKQNMVGILRVAVSADILSPEELMCRDFDYPVFYWTDRGC